MLCPDCNQLQKNLLDKFSVSKVGRCVLCQNKYINSHPEDDLSANEYEVTVRVDFTTTVKARTEDEAQDSAMEKLRDKAQYDIDIKML